MAPRKRYSFFTKCKIIVLKIKCIFCYKRWQKILVAYYFWIKKAFECLSPPSYLGSNHVHNLFNANLTIRVENVKYRWVYKYTVVFEDISAVEPIQLPHLSAYHCRNVSSSLALQRRCTMEVLYTIAVGTGWWLRATWNTTIHTRRWRGTVDAEAIRPGR